MSKNGNYKDKSKQDGLDTETGLHKKMDRKHFLQQSGNIAKFVIGGSVLGPLLPMSCSSETTAEPAPPTPPVSKKNPFQLSVASGDPLPDGVVLWTRLAPEPLSVLGGMSSEPVDVKWEVSEDRSFKKIVKQGTATATPRYAHSVHVEVDGLEPFHNYYYRFKAGSEVSPIGRTKTAPANGAHLDQLNFAFASCQNYPSGYFTAYKHLVEENLDVVFFLGDYIYQGGDKGHIGRSHIPGYTIQSLTDFRIRYGQYKSDPLLQAAHEAFPWIVTFDDHEVKNNWAGDQPSADSPDGGTFLSLRANAFQAYYEHMPLRKNSIPVLKSDIQIYRRFSYGNLAEFNVLDTRQFRSDYACGTSHNANCAERKDPSRSIIGEEQEQWLFDGLKQSSALWNLVPQQVFMAQMDREAGPKEVYSMDKWDGYQASRERLFKVIKQNNVSNFVVLTGDIHGNFVDDLLEDFSDPNSPVLGSELVVTSISSAGDGADISPTYEKYLAENPWIKFANRQRGYVRCQLTAGQLKADYRVMPYVEKPNAPIHTRASFVIKNGQAGAVQV